MYIYVAPRVGAWIETLVREINKRLPGSHPVWVRGLKPKGRTLKPPLTTVAPRVGAWIETDKSLNLSSTESSHPVWVRGLKQHP